MGKENNCRKVDPITKHKNYNKEIYEAYCERKKKHVDLGAPSIYYSARPAIVGIQGSTYIEGPRLYQNQFTGFFVEPGVVCTVSHALVVPTLDGTLGNTRTDSNGNTIPYPLDPVNGTSAPGVQRLGNFDVTVNDVNFCGESYTYKADLLGMSPSLEVGVLKINQTFGRRCSQPDLEKHAVLRFGDSRCTAIGEEIFVVGGASNAEDVGICSGMVIDNLYADNKLRSYLPDSERGNGYWGFEAIVTDANVMPANSGSPVLNAQGRVIGMVVGVDTASGYVSKLEQPVGPETDPDLFFTANYSYRVICVTSHILRRVVKSLVCGPEDPCLGGHVQLINDPLGDYYRYKYAWLQILGFEAYNSQTYHYVPNPEYRKQQGFIITEAESTGPIGSIVPLYQDFQYPPTGNPVPPTANNDIMLITRINESPVGCGAGQVPMTSLTFMHVDGEALAIEYRLGSDNFKCGKVAYVIGSYFPLDQDLPPRYTNTLSSSNNPLSVIRQRNLELEAASRQFNPVNLAKLLDDEKVHLVLHKILDKLLKAENKVLDLVQKAGDKLEDFVHNKVDDVFEAVDDTPVDDTPVEVAPVEVQEATVV